MKSVLITGVCGFIGYHLANKLKGVYDIVGIDNMDNYYDITLKQERLNRLEHVDFIECDISDLNKLNEIFYEYRPNIVINLAAQAGVRYSFINPQAYIQSNIVGFHNILECCRNYKPDQLIFASSSSVYGNNTKVPFSEEDDTTHPISLYAMTKKSNELEACVYSNSYKIPTIGLRFFTVYGEYGRPDMAYFKFADNLINNKPIEIFNNGECYRDFTYVGDVVEAIAKVIGYDDTLYEIYNIGNGNPTKTDDFIDLLCQNIEKHGISIPCNKFYLPKQTGDVDITFADTVKFEKRFGSLKHTDLDTGLNNFIKWYLGWRGKKK